MTPMTPTIVITEHFSNLSSQSNNKCSNNKPKINLEEILTQIESVNEKVVHNEGGNIESNETTPTNEICDITTEIKENVHGKPKCSLSR